MNLYPPRGCNRSPWAGTVVGTATKRKERNHVRLPDSAPAQHWRPVMASLKSDVETIVNVLCRDHGCKAKLTTSGHWRVSRPGHQPITMSRTPSDQRVLKSIRGDVRKYLGVDLSAG